jgi:hypothetical protein
MQITVYQNWLHELIFFFPFSENPKQDGQIRSPPPKIAKPSEAFYQTSSSDEDETTNTGNLLANT